MWKGESVEMWWPARHEGTPDSCGSTDVEMDKFLLAHSPNSTAHGKRSCIHFGLRFLDFKFICLLLFGSCFFFQYPTFISSVHSIVLFSLLLCMANSMILMVL